jgi:hypothetical protein
MAEVGLRWCGASRLNRRRISMSKSTKKRSVASARVVAAGKPAQLAPVDPRGKKAGPASKQSRATAAPQSPNRRASTKQEAVLGLLRQPQGATMAAMVHATGWQQHSVRGFLAGVVRKRLKLKLASDKVDGTRVYRIPPNTDAKSGSRSPKRTRRTTESPDRASATE